MYQLYAFSDMARRLDHDCCHWLLATVHSTQKTWNTSQGDDGRASQCCVAEWTAAAPDLQSLPACVHSLSTGDVDKQPRSSILHLSTVLEGRWITPLIEDDATLQAVMAELSHTCWYAAMEPSAPSSADQWPTITAKPSELELAN